MIPAVASEELADFIDVFAIEGSLPLRRPKKYLWLV
jgi:hypothetical protein